MSPMLILKRKMNTIKQLGKGDNACQRPPGITQSSKNNSLKNAIKSIFYLNMHHGPIRV